MIKKTHIRCSVCKGKGEMLKPVVKKSLRNTIPDSPYIQTKDTKRMLEIMRRYGLSQLTLAKVLGISNGTVNGWLHRKTNLKGKIRSIYFEMLKMKGYE